MTISARRTAVIAILLTAALLRFTALGWGLRHTPVRDEQDFVENAGLMLRNRDWDHRFYEYPGLFFDILRPVLSFAPREGSYFSEWSGFGRRTLFGPSGYLLARGVVAAFGVGSVALAYRLGVALLAPEAAVVGAALLAVSPVEVFVGHEVRPDVVLEFFVLLALLSFRRLGESPRDDVGAGLAVGAAAAVKFTGVLLAPTYLVARFLVPGARARGLLAAGLTAAAIWALATPYALVHPEAFAQGVRSQVEWHYRGRALFAEAGHVVLYYLRTIAWSLGCAGAILALLGLGHALPRLRSWAPVLTYPTLLVLALSSAHMHWHRLVLSGLGTAALTAAAGFEVLRQRWPRLAWGAASLTLVLPLSTSVLYLRGLAPPSPRDLAVDWTEAHLQGGARILNAVHELGLDRSRFEVVQETGVPGLDRLIARQSDLVIWRGYTGAPIEGFDTVWKSGRPHDPGGAFGESPEMSLRSMGQPIVLLRPSPLLRSTYAPISLEGSTVAATSNAQTAAFAVDSRMDTLWSTQGPQRPHDAFQILLPRHVRLGRVELLLGDRMQRYGRAVRISVTEDGSIWKTVPSANARPPVEEQLGRASQLIVFEPVWTRGVRVEAGAFAERAFGFAEIRLDLLVDR